LRLMVKFVVIEKTFIKLLTIILNQVYIVFQCSPLFKDRQTGLVSNSSRLVPLFLGARGKGRGKEG
jgi:hypothetical protein